jgi:hypothetical protein
MKKCIKLTQAARDSLHSTKEPPPILQIPSYQKGYPTNPKSHKIKIRNKQ